MKITKIFVFSFIILIMAISTGFALHPFQLSNILDPKNLIILGIWLMIIGLWGRIRKS